MTTPQTKTREEQMPRKAERVAVTVRDAYDEDACANFKELCKEEHLTGSGILKEYMRLYVEEHHRKQQLLEKARLVPVYKPGAFARNET
tara:strand:+ start:479 stop:745 length:267 start_codon:yes stop_codon:yes gene_type:complete